MKTNTMKTVNSGCRRRFAAFLMAMCMMALVTGARAECDTSLLMSQAGAQTFTVEGVGLAIRTRTTPFFGTCDSEDWELNLLIDFVDLYEENVTAVRVTASTAGWSELEAGEMSLTVGKKTYTFTPSRLVSEYDLNYYEDFYVCLGDEGLELIRALAKGSGKCTVRLNGTVTLSAEVTIPADDVSSMYRLYQQAGGTKQDLSAVDERWPVTISQ